MVLLTSRRVIVVQIGKSRNIFAALTSDVDDLRFTRSFTMRVMEGTCPAWRTWAEVFGASPQDGHMVGHQAEIVQYVAYACIAVCSYLSHVSLAQPDMTTFSYY